MKKNRFLILFFLSLTSCTSVKLPPALTTEELIFIKNHKVINATVEVEEDCMYPAYSRHLYETLKEINVFTEVTYQTEYPRNKIAYIVKMNRRTYGTNSTLSLLTILSLGIIPTWEQEEYGICFMLKSTNKPSEMKHVAVNWTGTTLMGWIMLFANLSPDRSFFSSYDSERFRDRIKLEILKACCR